jgi:hypothetical protein
MDYKLSPKMARLEKCSVLFNIPRVEKLCSTLVTSFKQQNTKLAKWLEEQELLSQEHYNMQH